MNVEPVNEEALKEIASWLPAWGRSDEWPEGWLSDTGFWVPGLAAGWLVTTNSKRALIEDFLSNREADRATVYAALIAVEQRIVDVAKSLGFRYLVGTTKLETVRHKVRAAGYQVTDPVFSMHKKELT